LGLNQALNHWFKTTTPSENLHKLLGSEPDSWLECSSLRARKIAGTRVSRD
jgi:uncharacterized protein YeaO (DUF488 family)